MMLAQVSFEIVEGTHSVEIQVSQTIIVYLYNIEILHSAL